MCRYSLLALGGNLPSKIGMPIQTLSSALMCLNQNGIHLRAISRFFQTPCFPAGAGPDYVNAAAVITTDLSSDALLAQIHQIEADFGRERISRWAGRSLDIDVIAIEQDVVPNEEIQSHWRNLPLEVQKTTAPSRLILPHPRLQDRGFVLAPLMDVAPKWRHPVLGLTVAQMFAQLPNSAQKEPRAL